MKKENLHDIICTEFGNNILKSVTEYDRIENASEDSTYIIDKLLHQAENDLQNNFKNVTNNLFKKIEHEREKTLENYYEKIKWDAKKLFKKIESSISKTFENLEIEIETKDVDLLEKINANMYNNFIDKIDFCLDEYQIMNIIQDVNKKDIIINTLQNLSDKLKVKLGINDMADMLFDGLKTKIKKIQEEQ